MKWDVPRIDDARNGSKQQQPKVVERGKGNTTKTHQQATDHGGQSNTHAITNVGEGKADGQVAHEGQGHEDADIGIPKSQGIQVQCQDKGSASIAKQPDHAQQDEDLDVPVGLPDGVGSDVREAPGQVFVQGHLDGEGTRGGREGGGERTTVDSATKQSPRTGWGKCFILEISSRPLDGQSNVNSCRRCTSG